MKKTENEVVRKSIYHYNQNGTKTYFESVRQAMRRKGLSDFMVAESVNRIGSMKMRMYTKLHGKWEELVYSLTQSGKLIRLH